MVICHEHVGAPRVWSEDERSFAVVVAALVSLALETERRVRQEQALAGVEARYQHLVEQLPCVVYAFDFRTGALDYVSPNAVELGGWTADRWLAAGTADAWIARIDPADRPAVLARFDPAIATDEPPELTYRVALPDGSSRWIRDACTVVRDAVGAPLAIQGTLSDVTAIRHAELTVAEHQRRFEELFSTVDLIGVILDGDGRIVRVNDAGAAALGRNAEELVGAAWNQVALTPDDRATAPSLPTGRVLGRVRRADGELRLVDWTHTLTRDASGAVVQVASLGVDLSKRAEVEAAVLRDARFETLGRVTALVAHDLANLITILESTIDELADTSDAASSLLNPLRQVSLRARGMMHMIRSAGSTADEERVETRCDLFARDNEQIWRLMARGRATLQVTADVEATALVDASSLAHLVTNLVGNALDATPAKGTVRISVERAAVDASLAIRHGASPGEFVVITVSDSGAGIAPEVQARIFEPFFTTKTHGSGLGLAGARGIAKRHGGFITLESALGHGTTIRVFLPALAEAATVRAAGSTG
jgi:PAS domain S-box-containing protein